MLGDLRASVYDLFGYFVPGSLGLVGVILVFWSTCHRTDAGDLSQASSAVVLTGFIVVAYVLGHLLQAVGNLLGYFNRVSEKTLLGEAAQAEPAAERTARLTWGKSLSLWLTTPGPPPDGPLSAALLGTVNGELKKHFRQRTPHLSVREKYGFIDEARSWAPREGEREVYIYREGFNRGMAVASALLGCAFLIRGATAPESCFLLDFNEQCFGRVETAVVGVLFLLCVPTFRRRMERFARYRVERAIMLWLGTIVNAKLD